METTAACTAIIAASILLLDDIDNEEQDPIRTKWVNDWVKKRETMGCYTQLMQELRFESPVLFRNFLRMSTTEFDFLESLVAPLISKKVSCYKSKQPLSDVPFLYLTLPYSKIG